MTTPGGVDKPPQDALTLDNLASRLQDMSPTAMRGRAVERLPSIMSGSTGLDPSLDITPFGILTSIYSGVMSRIATADPAAVKGPDDLPGLVVDFIEAIPAYFIGQFVGLLDAALGNYTGDDESLLAFQQLFAPVRKLLQLLTGTSDGFPTVDQISSGVNDLLAESGKLINAFIAGLTKSAGGAGGLDSLAQVISGQIGLLGGSITALAQLQQQFAAGQANLQAQIAALRNSIGSAAVSGAFDDFNRAGPSLGDKWVNIDGSLAIVNSDFVRTNAFAAGLHVTSAASQKHVVTARLTAKYPGTVRIIMSSNDTMTNYAAIEARVGFFGDDYLRIVTGSSPRLVVGRRQADFLGYRLPSECIIALEYDPVTNAFIASLNGDPVMDPWVDADNVVTHGSDKVRCGVVSNADNAGYVFGLGGIPAGPGITDFAMFDRPLI